MIRIKCDNEELEAKTNKALEELEGKDILDVKVGGESYDYVVVYSEYDIKEDIDCEPGLVWIDGELKYDKEKA